MGPMIETLKDSNKLVRWRAGRFLFELGDESALPALREAQNDPEFEVRMQIRQAIERIESGKAGQGPVWRQMTRSIERKT
jgi:HEAT repeat protein